MKTFEYKGFDQRGRAARGLIEGLDLKDVREKLAGRGILAESVDVAGNIARRWSLRRRAAFDLDMRATLYRELSVLLKAGLPLSQALEVLIDAPETGPSRTVLAHVRDRIREGSALGEALAEVSGRVRPFERAAVEVGEQSGALHEALDRLASFLEEQRSLRDRVQTALIYPAIVITVAVVIAALMLGVMMPRFASLFSEARIELPLLTRCLLNSGTTLAVLAGSSPVIVILGIVWLRRRLSRDHEFRVRFDRWVFAVPLFGRGYTALVNLRFARTLALLLRGGVPLVDSMLLAGRATGSAWADSLAQRESDAVRHGSSLADAIRRIPPLAGSLPGWVRAGEASGDLETLLEKAAERYQQRWDRLVIRSLEVVEPALILLVGALVLVLALAVLTPVLSLNKGLL